MSHFYSTFGCLAITARGNRCGHRHQVEVPVTFAWDPVRGVGVGAPSIMLCRMHDYLWSLDVSDRVQIVGGWMGRAWNPGAKVWTVMTTVYESKDGLTVSRHWWSLRHDTKFGDCKDVAYEDAVAALDTGPTVI